jgi:hypothetical protein
MSIIFALSFLFHDFVNDYLDFFRWFAAKYFFVTLARDFGLCDISVRVIATDICF